MVYELTTPGNVNEEDVVFGHRKYRRVLGCFTHAVRLLVLPRRRQAKSIVKEQIQPVPKRDTLILVKIRVAQPAILRIRALRYNDGCRFTQKEENAVSN